MSGSNITHYWLRYFLIILILLQAVSGIAGGIMLVIDPSGTALQMPLEILAGSPFKSFLVPGLILMIVLGIFPVFVLIGLVWKPGWKWANILNIYQDHHWSRTYALYTGIMLVIWIIIQLQIIKTQGVLHTIYALLGMAIIMASLLPPVLKYYDR